MAMSDHIYRVDNMSTGFLWGPVEVTRFASDDKGGVWLGVRCDGGEVEIRVTPRGQKMVVQVVGNVEVRGGKG